MLGEGAGGGTRTRLGWCGVTLAVVGGGARVVAGKARVLAVVGLACGGLTMLV